MKCLKHDLIRSEVSHQKRNRFFFKFRRRSSVLDHSLFFDVALNAEKKS